MKNFDDVIRSRAVFIMLEFVEHPETSSLILGQIKKKKKEVDAVRKELPKAKGLQILSEKL